MGRITNMYIDNNASFMASGFNFTTNFTANLPQGSIFSTGAISTALDYSYTDHPDQEFLLNTTMNLTSNVTSSVDISHFSPETASINCSICSDNATGQQTNSAFPYSMGVKVFLAMITFLIAFGAVTGNLVILITISLTKRLRTLNSAFLLNLSASDLLMGAIVIPFVLYNLIDRRHTGYEKVFVLYKPFYITASQQKCNAFGVVSLSKLLRKHF